MGREAPQLPDNDEVFKTFPEVGEGRPPKTAMLYHGGVIEIIKGDSASLYNRGFEPYPSSYLTTNHALVLTRALAAFHAISFKEKDIESSQLIEENADKDIINRDECCGKLDETECSDDELSEKPKKSYQDRWTAEISRLELVQSNLEILCNRLRCRGHNPRTVQKLEALQSDLPTLTQFLQFASAMQNNRSKSVGPIGICDVWVNKDDNVEDEETVVIRLRGGPDLKSPHLRDAAWLWLTLLTPDMLRDRYMELCGVYCDHYNNTLRKIGAFPEEEELSFFNVMQDLGENFLHAFLTIVHKFVLSGNWYMDRQLHTQEGLQALADVISFLVDNGIIGSIFVI